jgi:hypothetical protein
LFDHDRHIEAGGIMFAADFTTKVVPGFLNLLFEITPSLAQS